MSQFEAVLFDAGDTLIRLSGSGETLLHQAAANLGVSALDADETGAVWQRVLARSSTAEELAKGRDLSSVKHREIWTSLYTYAGCESLARGLSDELYQLTISASSWEAFPDTLPTLQAVHELGLPIGVVSDTGFDLRPIFDSLGMAGFLSTLVMSFESGVCKPAPKAFLLACQQMGVRPERTLMVGDNPLTDSGAVAVGMPVLLLPPAPKSGPRGLGHVLSLVN